MYQVSEAFAAAMKSRPYIARITLDGTDVIEGDPVQEIVFRGGANASPDTVTLGGAVSGSVELTLDQTQVTCAIESRELFVELGMELESGTEWIPMGEYTAQDPVVDDGVLTVTALDALGTKLDVDYEPLEGFDFASGVSSTAFLAALCARRGVEVNVDGLADIVLQGSPEGFTERQIVGFIAALYGGFARVDRLGVLRICRYTQTDAVMTADDYYEDGLEAATYTFQAGWLKCRNPGTNVTLISGDPEAAQGFYLESLWMTQERLDDLCASAMGAYMPAQKLSFLGDPRLDPGDIIQVQTPAGEAAVPVMTICHEFDGGLITTVSAAGQAKTAEPTSPVMQAVNNAAKKMTQQEVFNKLTNNGELQGLYMQDGQLYINASYLRAGTLDASLIKVINLIAEKLSSVSGSSEIRITGAELRMLYEGLETLLINNEFGADPIMYLNAYEDGVLTDAAELTARKLGLGGSGIARKLELGVNSDGKPYLILGDSTSDYPKYLDWINVGSGLQIPAGTEDPQQNIASVVVPFGQLPSSGYAWKELPALDITKVINITGRCFNENECNMFPVYLGGSIGAYCWVDSSGIGVRAVQDMSAFQAEFVVTYFY